MKGIKKRIDLGPAIIGVRWVNEVEMADITETPVGGAPDGAWDDEAVEILLHQRLKKTPRYARQILLHEIGHAALDLYHQVT